MTLLDAFAVIAYFRDEPAKREVIEILQSESALTAVNAAEVIDILTRIFQGEPDDVEADLAILGSAGLKLVPVDNSMGIAAGRLRSHHYDRARRAVSMADCVAVSAALALRGGLATADPALAAMAREEGVEVTPLPDSSGRRP